MPWLRACTSRLAWSQMYRSISARNGWRWRNRFAPTGTARLGRVWEIQYNSQCKCRNPYRSIGAYVLPTGSNASWLHGSGAFFSGGRGARQSPKKSDTVLYRRSEKNHEGRMRRSELTVNQATMSHHLRAGTPAPVPVLNSCDPDAAEGGQLQICAAVAGWLAQ